MAAYEFSISNFSFGICVVRKATLVIYLHLTMAELETNVTEIIIERKISSEIFRNYGEKLLAFTLVKLDVKSIAGIPSSASLSSMLSIEIPRYR